MKDDQAARGLVDRWIHASIRHPLPVVVLFGLVAFAGLVHMPFDPGIDRLPHRPIPVDALPDIGENQQIVYAEWPGHSPQEVEDQVTTVLAGALQGAAGVRTVRSRSMPGLSMCHVVFAESMSWYDSRTRLGEKLAELNRRLPEGVDAGLGPDATALGQIFWYRLEGEDFDLEELRSIQDVQVKIALQAVPGVAEVASIGGSVREWQVDVDPAALRERGVRLRDVIEAVRRSNLEVGAGELEWNGIEYSVRGLGLLSRTEQLEEAPVPIAAGGHVRLGEVARVGFGPAPRRGVLDRAGKETVGGVVAMRHGENPRAVIQRIRSALEDLAPSLPARTDRKGAMERVRVLPFHDRSTLVEETLDTLGRALYEEILITIFVVLLFLRGFRAAGLICINLPIAVLVVFAAMKVFGVESNLMSLGGIALAIGSMVDMGIILVENIVRRLREAPPGSSVAAVTATACCEVGGAATTAVLTTLFSFLPVFALEGAEGKLFMPLAWTKSLALAASLLVALGLGPLLAARVFAIGKRQEHRQGAPVSRLRVIFLALAGLFVLWRLAAHWMPLGPGRSLPANLVFVLVINGAWVLLRLVFARYYGPILHLVLAHRRWLIAAQIILLLAGGLAWFGFDRVFAALRRGASAIGIEDRTMRSSSFWAGGEAAFPGMGHALLPPLDEGTFLFMPSTMGQAGIEEAHEILRQQDRAIAAIPEVAEVVGKIGRVESALDPAPIGMIETIVTIRPEWGPIDPETGRRPRLWRDSIVSTDMIWQEIEKAGRVPGATSAPRLQPIAARLVMLSSGIRSNFAVRLKGRNLEALERAGLAVADLVSGIDGVDPSTVVPDRIAGRPWIDVEPDRERLARVGLSVEDLLRDVEAAVGGHAATTTIEGRERRVVRVRLERGDRDDPDGLARIPIAVPGGAQLPLSELARIVHRVGPQEIRGEDGFLASWVLFDKRPGAADVEVAEAVEAGLRRARESGALELGEGISLAVTGGFEGQLRFQEKLELLLPLALLLVFLVLYLQFRSVPVALIVFSGIAVCWAGAFVGLRLLAVPGFLDFDLLGANLREVFHLGSFDLSVPMWIGFIALFGVATDDAVLISTYHEQVFARERPTTVAALRELVVQAGRRRIRPCLMTTSTTVLALLPVLASSGRGADLMIPMVLPLAIGMTFELLTLFTVPVLYSAWRERRLRVDA